MHHYLRKSSYLRPWGGRLLLLMLLSGAFRADSQVRELVFTSFPADSVLQVSVDIADSVEVRSWHNSAIFVETQVDMTVCSENLLKAAVEKGRYGVAGSRTGQGIVLKQADMKRVVLNSPKGACGELVVHRIYLPVGFKPGGDRVWSRPEDSNKTTINY